MAGYFILGGILGLLLGAGIGLAISANILFKSNNLGDSKGTIFDFSKKGINMIYSANRIKKNTYIPVVDATPTTPESIELDQRRIEGNRIKIKECNKGLFSKL